MNLRFRLALWCSFILFLSLFTAAGTGYWRIKEVLIQQFDRELSEELVIVTRIYADEKHENEMDTFKKFVSGMDFHFVIFDREKKIVLRSEGTEPSFPGLSADEMEQLDKGGTLLKTVPGNRVPRRIIIQKVPDTGGEILMLSEDMDRIDYVMVRLRAAALVIIFLFLILSAVGGWWMASRALAPIDEIVQTARQIQASNLSLRIPVAKQRDEIGNLIVTLNTTFDRLESAFARIRRFTQDAAHELRTPLSSILSAADVTLRRPRSSEEYREALEAVRDETLRLQKLADNLLTLARAELPSAAGRCDISETCQQVLKDFRAQIDSKKIKFDTRLESGNVVIQEDALVQIVRNLVDNAIKFSAETSSIRMSGDAKDVYTLEIEDGGDGIDLEDLPHVFSRFYRGKNATDQNIPGTGLGLAIARDLARQAGGDLTAENGQKGRGAIFKLSLPLFT